MEIVFSRRLSGNRGSIIRSNLQAIMQCTQLKKQLRFHCLGLDQVVVPWSSLYSCTRSIPCGLDSAPQCNQSKGLWSKKGKKNNKAQVDACFGGGREEKYIRAATCVDLVQAACVWYDDGACTEFGCFDNASSPILS